MPLIQHLRHCLCPQSVCLASARTLGYVGRVAGEVQPLLAAVDICSCLEADFSGCYIFCDPPAGSETVSTAFSVVGYTLTNNYLDRFWDAATSADVLRPGSYHLITSQIMIDTTPLIALLDLVIPLVASQVALAAVCMILPKHWLSNPQGEEDISISCAW